MNLFLNYDDKKKKKTICLRIMTFYGVNISDVVKLEDTLNLVERADVFENVSTCFTRTTSLFSGINHEVNVFDESRTFNEYCQSI